MCRYLALMLLGAVATVLGFLGMNVTLRWCRRKQLTQLGSSPAVD